MVSVIDGSSVSRANSPRVVAAVVFAVGCSAVRSRSASSELYSSSINPAAFSLIAQQRSVSGSPTAAPVVIEAMLDFASRHQIVPQTEHYPMSHINEAFARLDSGKARYRIVLDADF